MATFAIPAATFSSRRLIIHAEPVGAIWQRLYLSRHLNPLGFGLAKSRFSDSTGKAFGVIYLGSSVKVAFNEVILRDRGDGRVGPLLIPYAEIEDYTCAEIEIATALRLVNLTGDAGLKMGVPTDVVGARDQKAAQAWSLAFHKHDELVDGVFYPSRLNEERNIALYDRALSKLKARSTPLLKDLRGPLAAILNDLDIEIV